MGGKVVLRSLFLAIDCKHRASTSRPPVDGLVDSLRCQVLAISGVIQATSRVHRLRGVTCRAGLQNTRTSSHRVCLQPESGPPGLDDAGACNVMWYMRRSLSDSTYHGTFRQRWRTVASPSSNASDQNKFQRSDFCGGSRGFNISNPANWSILDLCGQLCYLSRARERFDERSPQG